MLSAITSLVSKTIDVFLKLNSGEARRRKFSKDIFDVYSALSDVERSLARIEDLLSFAAEPDALDDYDAYVLLSKTPLPDYVSLQGYSEGRVMLTANAIDIETFQAHRETDKFEPTQALPLFLSEELKFLVRSFARVAHVLESESMDLCQAQHQPKVLETLGIYDADLVRVFTRAWFLDGGFVNALRGFGITHDAPNAAITMTDAEFNPSDPTHGYAIVPDERHFSLNTKQEREKLQAILTECKRTVTDAKESMTKFMKQNCSLEDIL